MLKLPVLSMGLLCLGISVAAFAEMPERPLPPAPMEEQMGTPADCDPAMRSSDPEAESRDCPTRPEPYRDDAQNRAKREKGKPPTLDPDSGGRELDPPRR